MSQPILEEFEVIVTLDREGNPATLRYYDGVGCGHESCEIDLDRPIRELVQYHISHCARHGVYPKKKCSYSLVVDGEKISCKRDLHDSGPHTLDIEA